MSKLQKAIERAKKDRGEDSAMLLQKAISPERKAMPITDDGTSRSHGVQISYSQTKIQKTDPQILASKKIVSLFKENEMSDQISILRSQILNKLKEIQGNSFLITSANPGEGKTFMAINLGVSIAQELDRTVLIVDGDLKKPYKNHCDFSEDFFCLEKQKGLSDYLLAEAEIPELLLNPGIQKLTILPAGRPLSNSAELLGSARMRTLAYELNSRYREDRIVIYDSSCLLGSSDPLAFSSLVDGILLIVEAEKTTPSELKKVKELLKGTMIIGTVVNKAKGDM